MSDCTFADGSAAVRRRAVMLVAAVGLSLWAPSDARAELATVEEMANVGHNWVEQMVAARGQWAGVTDPQITGVHEIRDNGVLLARYYDVAPRGYVLVPALKEMPPVQIYSDESNLGPAQENGVIQMVTEILKSRMEAFAATYGSTSAVQPATGGVFDPVQKTRWEKLAVAERDFRADQALSIEAEGGPLLTSSWHQREPYYDSCPMGDAGRTVVGCVATSASQIMDYWEWPPNGVGSYSYWWPGDNSCGGSSAGGWQTADFSDAYDWANMPDSCDDADGCTPEESAALAELCRDVGVALNMDYGRCGSGTFLDKSIFPTYFKYSADITSADRLDHTQQGWFDLARQEVDAGRPVWYRINSHAIVCDGYRDQYGQLEYHMNYGWGEEHTAWYVLDNLYCSWIEGDVCPYEEEFMIYNIKPQTVPILTLAGHELGEQGGDGDGHLDPGESATITASARNLGNDAADVQGVLSTTDPNITIVTPSAAFESPIGWGATGASTTPFVISVNPACPDPHWATLDLTITADGGYETAQTFYLFIGDTPGLQASFDDGQGFWTHAPQTVAYGDNWHLETYRYYNGTASWKHGGAAADTYDDLSDGGLVSPPFLLPPDAKLRFMHWIQAEDDANNTAWDGGIVMMSSGDGVWVQITPTAGYPYSIIDNPASPFMPYTPCYSGQYPWQPARFELGGYSGVVQIMFRFGSDGAVAEEGWYIDDFIVCNTLSGSLAAVAPLENLSLTFSEVTGNGNTLATVSSTGPALPPGYAPVPANPAAYYTVTSSASWTAPVEIVVGYEDDDYTRDESGLCLYQYQGDQWVDITSWRDPLGNRIAGETNALDPLVIVERMTCCEGRVGDPNGEDGDEPTIGDVSTLIDMLFLSLDPVVCLPEGDIDQSGGPDPVVDAITIGDVSVLIDYLFITGSSLGLPDCL